MQFPDRGGPVNPPIPVPGLPWVPSYAWINTDKLNITQWRGYPVVIDVWNIQCPNCIKTLPWLRHVEERYAPQGLKFIGIHTPEFPEDHDVARVRAEIEALGIDTPVMMDNQYDYWRALGNRYWPTLYFVDRLGQIRYRKVGQLLKDSPEALETEKWIEELLSEPAINGSPEQAPSHKGESGDGCC